MELEISIKEICNGLKSVRATDRKKNAESLRDFLANSRSAVPTLLTQNSLQKKGYSWDHLFDDINEYILKETEKFETSKTYNTVIKPLCSSLLHSCVAGSNRGKAYITCSKITEICLYILKDKRLVKAVGDEYLLLLLKHVLSHKHYLGYITPNAWKELLDVCVSACLSDDFNLDNYTKLRLVHLVMLNGTDNCQFVKPLTSVLSMMEKCFIKVNNDKKAQEVVIEIVILLLETLSTECRLTMCHFVECNLHLLLKYYDQNKDPKKKSALFKMLNLAVILHHPLGWLQNEQGSLAHDWDQWNNYLQRITNIIYREVEYVQKNRKSNDKTYHHCSHFYQLAAFLHYKIFTALQRNEVDTDTNSPKRPRLSFKINKTFSELLYEMNHSHIPWLGVVHAYIQRYSTSIAASDYITLLNYMQALLTNDHTLDWVAFEELACLALKYLSSESDKTDDYDSTLMSLWNTCVRNCTTMNPAHKTIHTIIQLLLNLNCLKYEQAQALIKLYIEKDMPVTNHSIETLNNLFHKFYDKNSRIEFRVECFNWLTQTDLLCLDAATLSMLVVRITASENISLVPINTSSSAVDDVNEILLNSIEKCILFSELEKDVELTTPPTEHVYEQSEMITAVVNIVEEYFKNALTKKIGKLQRNHSDLHDCIKAINVVLSCYDMMMKHDFKTREGINLTEIYALLKTGLKIVYSSLILVLKGKEHVYTKVVLVKLVEELLVTEFETQLCTMLRSNIDGDFFHCINNILNVETDVVDNDIITEDDKQEANMTTLKHNCVYVLAAYCRKNVDYRDELLKLVLNHDLYNFPSDMPCVFRCIDLLKDANVEAPPLDLIFTLMQYVCKDWYRDSQVSLGILKILVDIIDRICSKDGFIKDNCCIMVKVYMQRCKDMYYSPQVASLLYECVAKIAVLNRKQIRYVDNTFESAIIRKLKGDVHVLRIQCCYLLKPIMQEFSDYDVETFFTDLLEIFLIDVVDGNELILKDESANRTLTVLHTFLALAQGRKSSIQNIILQVLNVQKVKSLDKSSVKKVLNKIINIRGVKDLQTYLNDNILPVIHFWFKKNNTVEQLPLYLFEFDNIDLFVKKHMKWLVAADILWRKRGNVTESDILKRIIYTQKLSKEEVLEICFSNIILLCLPYIVCDKYNIECYVSDKVEFNNLKQYASRMFRSMGQILENNKWSNLFVENVGELLLLAAAHLTDRENAERLFEVKLPQKSESYYYPERVFSAILDYFHELTDGNVILYLCQNQTTSVFKILVELWKNVIQEDIFEYRILALQTYLTFAKHIPLNCPSDAFVCNFVCISFTNAIKGCNDREELRVYIEGLKISLDHLLPTKFNEMRKAVLELLPVLVIKKEEGFQQECDTILSYLNVDMKEYLKESEGIIDFLNSISQGAADSVNCSSMTIFLEKLKAHKISLKCPSHETLLNIRQFLNSNKCFIRNLWHELDSKRFSEDCKTSVIHQFVYSLNCILKSAHDDKTIIEACNCLSEIGSYDLKTLVTVPPPDPQDVTGMHPKQYFAIAVVKALLDVLFDKDPVVTGKVTEALTSFLRCRQVGDILDLDDIHQQLLSPFLPPTSTFADTKVDYKKLDDHCKQLPNGVFLETLLLRDNSDDHWLKHVICTLLGFISSPIKDIDVLREVCTLKVQVCRNILPSLVGLILQCSLESQMRKVSEHINNFFNYIWEETFDVKLEGSGDSRLSARPNNDFIQDYKVIVQYMLDVVDFVRIQRTTQTRSNAISKRVNDLELEYDKIAWAAALAHQNWAAIYYGEMWAVLKNDGVAPTSPESVAKLTDGENLQRIFRKCYVSIGEIDAIEGCGTAHLTIEDEKRKHLINTGHYSDALLLYDIALSCGSHVDPQFHFGVVRSLHKSGMHHLALQYIKSQPDNEQLSDVKYECLSFLGNWSEFVDLRQLEQKSKQANCHQNSIIKAFQYVCLKNCLNVQNTSEHENKVLLPLNKAKLAVSRLSKHLNMENCQNVYKVLAKVHIFKDIEDYFALRTNTSEMDSLLQQWGVDKLPQFSDFKHLETLISQRVLLLEHAAKASNNLINEISSLQIQYAKMALSNHRVEMAQRLLTIAKKTRPSNDVILVESKISWAKGHKDIALSLLRNIILDQNLNAKLSAASLRQYALWIAELKCDNPRDIINKYLLKSLEELGPEHVGTRLKVYHDIAKFADAEYKQVVTYMNSSVYENRVKCVENMSGTASSLNEKPKKQLTNEERKALSCNMQFKALDEAEIASTRKEKENFLRLAMRYYLLSLRECNENNLSVFRVISLWLDNRGFDFKSNDSDDIMFENLLHTIPSWKYISALPQLAPHLTNDDNPFIKNLKKIIKRCAIEHPYHTLPILFGLKNSKKDQDVVISASRRLGRNVSQTYAHEHDARTLSAHALVGELAREQTLSAIIAQMENLCDAIISFANYEVTSKQKVQNIPDSETIHKLRNLNSIPVPTVTIPISRDCKYSYIHTLKSFDARFELVGGINCPKKINCKDSSGQNHVMLIKGRDDLRQDAVMQQVFNIVNALLEKDPVTNRNKLLIRTYKVVPMSRQSGVLEWCEGTVTFGGYLVGPQNKGAHARYRPQDISYDAARKMLIDCQTHKENNEKKLLVFKRILRDFKPVFHNFFTEHYLDPVTWYERRLAYTKSVATSSMLGYILGLGDRHVFNILIDQRTAEVIHIDLGIAFDQGKTLPTPETVPFRLTQDIISGFGSCGIEGIFRRCCEKTMQLLRDNQETLLTILEVLLCDPLYSWSVKTAQQNAPTANDSTKETTSDSNSGLAKRALLVVSSKLSGTEEGVAGGVAVAGQVARLLHAATDPFNLCRLYNGWQPYL